MISDVMMFGGERGDRWVLAGVFGIAIILDSRRLSKKYF
jgi:hypothetical protein